jgi:hypothetical protein
VIPKNVKFFGTLNQDATTMDLSPKVIDRSFILRLLEPKRVKVEMGDYSHKLQYLPLSMLADTTLVDKVNKFWEKMTDIGLVPSRRVKNIISNLINVTTESHQEQEHLINNLTVEQFIDILNASLLMPKIRIFKTNAANFQNDYEDILSVGNMTISKTIWDNLGKEHGIDFWGEN